jgi:uncharacterized MAPEG superfamily protein
MTTELWMLLDASLLALLLPVLQGIGAVRVRTLRELLGNRENFGELQGWSGRASRAHRNLLENLVPFAAIVLAVHAAGVHTQLTVMGAEIFLAARILHAIVYVAGLTVVRTLAFYAGTAGTLLVAAALF